MNNTHQQLLPQLLLRLLQQLYSYLIPLRPRLTYHLNLHKHSLYPKCNSSSNHLLRYKQRLARDLRQPHL